MKPVLVSTWGVPKKYHLAFLDTCARNGLEPQNADPSDWGSDDWRTIPWWKKSAAQARFIRETQGQYTHYAFCDAYDVVFCAGWEEILRKFTALNSPIVFGAECYCWPDVNAASRYPVCHDRARFLNAGFWMATAEAALPFAEELAEIAARKEKCDQGIVTDMFLSQRHPIKLDTRCSLLFCMNLDSPHYLSMDAPRPRATDTGETPALFHGNGGTDITKLIWHIAP